MDRQVDGQMDRWIDRQMIDTVGEKIIWSPADFERLPTDKEMISL